MKRILKRIWSLFHKKPTVNETIISIDRNTLSYPIRHEDHNVK